MWGYLIALLSGLLMSVQGVMNTGVTKQTSIWVSAGFVQLSAFVICVIAWLVTGRESIAQITQVTPKYMLLGGVIGAFITITVIKSMEILGPAKSVMLIVIMQIVSAYLIELMGILGTKSNWCTCQHCRNCNFLHVWKRCWTKLIKVVVFAGLIG